MRPWEGTEGQSKYGGMRSEDWRTFVKNFDCNLVSLADTTNDILLGNPKIVKVECACGASADSEFLLFLRDLDTHVLGGYEARDAFVALAWVDVGKDEKDLRLVAVRDPPGTRA